MSASGAPSKPLGVRVESPRVGELELSSLPPIAAATLPSAGAERDSLRAVFEDSATMDGRVSDAPLSGADRAANARLYLRAFSAGVTEEAPGRYREQPDGELGRGAIGRVFVAHDSHLARQVATKELLIGAGEPPDGSAALQTISRFLQEARVTGGLEHPGIVPVYELGRRANGALYYTMRVVRGRTLARAIAECRGLKERLALLTHFSGLCQTIAYAHSRGVVHRDIKPENVMIGEFGETVVLDWGMAKSCVGDSEEPANAGAAPSPLEIADLGLTVAGSLCGTPLYMSPEQASGRTHEVDRSSDVWSLGVVLYALLCGRPPFSGKSLLDIVAKVSAGRYTPLGEVDPEIPAELAAIVESALQTSKLDRYPSARELARDVQAYQVGTRVAVYEYSSLELAQRFVARQRSAVTATLLALVVVLVLSVSSYRRVVAARDRAILAEKRAQENELSAKHNADSARHSLGELLIQRAELSLFEGDSVDAERLAASALVQEERADARGLVIAARSALRPALSSTLSGSAGCARTALAISAGMFACAKGSDLTLWSVEEKAPARSLPLGSEVTSLAFASDESALAVVLSDGRVGFRQASFEEAPWRFERCGQKPTAAAVAAHGEYSACGNAHGDVTLWRAASARAERLELGQAVSALAFSEDGTKLVMGGVLGGLLVYDAVQRTRQVLAGHSGTVLALALADQGRYLASGGADRSLRFWDTTNGRQPQAPIAHSDTISALAWSEDRHFIALGGKDKTFRVLDLRTGQRALSRQYEQPVELVAISADGGMLASYSPDTGLRHWSLASAQSPPELSEHGNVLALALGAGPDQLLSAGLGKNGVCIWQLASGSCAARLPVRLDRVRALSVSPDRQRLAVAGSGSQIFIWDLAQKIPTQVIEGLRDETRALAFSLDGRTLAAAGVNRTLRIFDVSSAALLREIETGAPVQTLSVAPQSGELFSGDQAGVLTVWDMSQGKPQAAWQAHSDWVLGSAISADGTQLASASADRSVKIWDVRTRKRLFTLSGHAGKVMGVDFSPDGALLASAGEDKSVRLWDSRTGRALALLPGHSGVVRAVRFTSGGAILASGSDDGTIRLWRLESLSRAGAELEANVTQQFGLGLPEAAAAVP